MDIQKEIDKFITRMKSVNDWPVVIFAFCAGVFGGSILGTLLEMVIYGTVLLALLAGIWLFMGKVSDKLDEEEEKESTK